MLSWIRKQFGWDFIAPFSSSPTHTHLTKTKALYIATIVFICFRFYFCRHLISKNPKKNTYFIFPNEIELFWLIYRNSIPTSHLFRQQNVIGRWREIFNYLSLLKLFGFTTTWKYVEWDRTWKFQLGIQLERDIVV